MNIYNFILLSDYKGGEIYHLSNHFSFEELLDEVEVTEDISSAEELKEWYIKYFTKNNHLYGRQTAIFKDGSRMSLNKILSEITDVVIQSIYNKMI